jgi:adenylate cyclase
MTMPDLIAQGADYRKRWRRPLPADQAIELGRGDQAWGVNWDTRISRQHATLQWKEDRLLVEILPGASNPIFYQGVEEDRFEIELGEHFVIGETTFAVADSHLEATLQDVEPAVERIFSAGDLQEHRFGDPQQRIDILGQLPEIISRADNDTELFMRLVNLLLAGIPRASGAALVASDSPGEDFEGISVAVLHWDYRGKQPSLFAPSQRLIQAAVNDNHSIVHIWSQSHSNPQVVFTEMEGVDWAFCVPVDSPSCPGWAIYVAGEFASEDSSVRNDDQTRSLQDDMKFAKLAASTLGSLRHLKSLEQTHTHFRQFFPTVVLDALRKRNPDEVLSPRETDVSVMFCDLHGFSRESEQSSDDLIQLLERTSAALGIMTRQLLAHGGVVGDFHGDAVMGFWGWPLRQDDRVERACAAANEILSSFVDENKEGDLPLGGFQTGIGIATGKAVAGKIGSSDQVKVTVFGPVVNLAARLEAMTRAFGVAILVDGETDKRLRSLALRQETTSSGVQIPVSRLGGAEYYLRRVGRVLPYGMQVVSEISQLVRLDDIPLDTLGKYISLLADFERGNWAQLEGELSSLSEVDPVAGFLLKYITDRNSEPPKDFSGVIELVTK